MSITKFTDDKDNNKYNDVVVENASATVQDVFLKKLVDKLDEVITKLNEIS